MDLPRSTADALARATAALAAAGDPGGHWTGELSTSALSTATAVCALRLIEKHRVQGDVPGLPPSAQIVCAIQNGCAWLVAHPNADGSWGDTVLSHGNLSTTTLVWAALGGGTPAALSPTPAPGALSLTAVLERAEHWLRSRVGSLDPRALASAIVARYGEDRTFSVPILTACALMQRLGDGPAAWARVIPLPFELAAFPASWFAALRLPVVSYALPALIAIGYARHRHAPSRNPLVRWLRRVVAPRTLARLARMQPPNGGFLEATPLTSFVVMSLAASGELAHPVTRRGADFLLASQRPDGSWPIDTNLATWLTTLATNALAAGPHNPLSPAAREAIRCWLLNQQYRAVHPDTQAAPGGWAWTDLPGGVPDADDTAGALLALKNLGTIDTRSMDAAMAGLQWLLDVRNRDGGVPTFCRGWGRLAFDRSSADITAHAIRAWLAWKDEVPATLSACLDQAIRRALQFLDRHQLPDGSWLPLWFGNQYRTDEANPVYGTARVLTALAACVRQRLDIPRPAMLRGLDWLIRAQHPDGAWGGGPQTPPSVEETALAVEAISVCLSDPDAFFGKPPEVLHAAACGARWLAAQVASGDFLQPAPIGFYFAKLWYYEKLYPLIFTVGALGAYQSLTGSPASIPALPTRAASDSLG